MHEDIDYEMFKYYQSAKISESPESMIAKVEQRWYLPQAVPRDILFPW